MAYDFRDSNLQMRNVGSAPPRVGGGGGNGFGRGQQIGQGLRGIFSDRNQARTEPPPPTEADFTPASSAWMGEFQPEGGAIPMPSTTTQLADATFDAGPATPAPRQQAQIEAPDEPEADLWKKTYRQQMHQMFEGAGLYGKDIPHETFRSLHETAARAAQAAVDGKANLNQARATRLGEQTKIDIDKLELGGQRIETTRRGQDFTHEDRQASERGRGEARAETRGWHQTQDENADQSRTQRGLENESRAGDRDRRYDLAVKLGNAAIQAKRDGQDAHAAALELQQYRLLEEIDSAGERKGSAGGDPEPGFFGGEPDPAAVRRRARREGVAKVKVPKPGIPAPPAIEDQPAGAQVIPTQRPPALTREQALAKLEQRARAGDQQAQQILNSARGGR